MFITVINDCQDANAFGRQLTRISSLFKFAATPIGVGDYNELYAAGNLIDVLDAAGGEEGVVLVNVAPRGGKGKRWPNGTPFGYFYYGKTLIVSSIDGNTLSLIKKLGLASEINVMDIPTVLSFVRERNIIDATTEDYISKSQFRSYDFVPRVAHWLFTGVEVPSTKLSINEIPDAPLAIWLIDNFGNAKTTLLFSDLIINDNLVKTNFGDLKFYERLKDVPDREPAIIIGSSGIKDQRFVEIIVQGLRAETHFNLKQGDLVEFLN